MTDRPKPGTLPIEPPRLPGRLDAVLASALDERPGAGAVPGAVGCVVTRHGGVRAGAAGVRVAGRDDPATPDTVLALFSCTKPITAAAALQCIESGRGHLDEPVGERLPAIDRLRVLTGYDATGQALYRAPTRRVTVRHLLLHTAGFGYPFFSPTLAGWLTAERHPSVISGQAAALETPLLFDPGAQWEYGISTDWLGRWIEHVADQPLEEVLRAWIFDPLGMVDATFAPDRLQRRRLMRMHGRSADGVAERRRDLEPPPRPEQAMGGHGLYATAVDFARFLHCLLLNGRIPDSAPGAGATLLQPGTLAPWLTCDPAVQPALRRLPSADPELTGELLLPRTAEEHPARWSPMGAFLDPRASTLRWCGLANLYYWLDPASGVAGFWGTQLLPFGDPGAVDAAGRFEQVARGCVSGN